MFWNMRTNEKLADEIFTESPGIDEPSKSELLGIDTFFVFRAAAYAAVGIMVVLLSMVWDAAYTRSQLTIAIVILCLTICFSGRMLYIGKIKKYFILELTCVDIHFPKGSETIGSFLNPMSQTAFRRTQRVSFTDENGNKVAFSFERGRRFLEGGKYAFYFHALQPGECVTVDILERMKIDHRAISQPINLT